MRKRAERSVEFWPDTQAAEWEARVAAGSTFPSPPLAAEVLHVAAAFESSLAGAAAKIAANAGTSRIPVSSPEISLTQPVIATGHQPVVYHPGLTAKEEFAVRLSGLRSGIALNFILDLDEQDCLSFEIPHPGATATARSASELTSAFRFDDSNALPVDQRIARIPAVDGADTPTQHTLKLYEKLLMTPVNIAHAAVRRLLLRSNSLLHVPFSLLFARPLVQETLRIVLCTPDLARRYNSAMDRFRAEQRIKNSANPFPNLAEGELPAWVWNPGTGGKRVFSVGTVLQPRELLVPRGALVTAFLRRYCCDLFVHGLGGKAYEPAVEMVAAEIFENSTFAPYCVVSSNVYPFSDGITEFESLSELTDLIRSGPSHLETLSKRLGLEQSVSSELSRLALRRADLVASLSEAKTVKGSDTKAIGLAIKELDSEIRTKLIGIPQVEAVHRAHARLAEFESTLYRRDFPFWVSA